MADASGIRAGRGYLELSVQDKFSRGLAVAEQKLRNLGDSIAGIGKKLAAVGIGTITAVAGIATAYANMGDVVAKAATRMGLEAEAISSLSYAAKQSGADLDTLETAFKKMAKTITGADDESKSAQKSLSDLGIEVGDIVSRRPDEQFKLLADRISQIQDPTKRAAAAMAVFGKAGTQLIPLIENGAAGIVALQKEAERLGLVMSTEDAKAAEEFGDRMDDLNATIKSAIFHIGAAFAPVVRELTLRLTSATAATTQWLKENRQTLTAYAELVMKAALYSAAIGSLLFVLGKLIGIAGAVVGAIKSIAGALILIAANPAVAALSALVLVFSAATVAAKLLEIQAIALNRALRQLPGDQTREVMKAHIDTLAALAGKTKLTADEMKSAQAAIAALSERYGTLGASVNTATRELVGFSAAQVEMLRQQERQKKLTELRDAIKSLAGDVADAEAKIQTLGKAQDGVGGLWVRMLGGGSAFNVLLSKWEQDQKRLTDLRKEERDLTRGADPFPGAQQNQNPAAAKAAQLAELAEAYDEARKNLNELQEAERRAGMSDTQRKIAEISAKYKEQADLFQRLIDIAKQRGDESDAQRLGQEWVNAWRRATDEVKRIKEDAVDKELEDFHRAMDEEQRRIEQAKAEKRQHDQEARDQQSFLLGLEEQIAENEGQTGTAQEIQKKKKAIEFEGQLESLFGDNEALKEKAREMFKVIQAHNDPNKPNPIVGQSRSQGIFNVAALQSLQGGGDRSESQRDKMIMLLQDLSRSARRAADHPGVLFA